MNVLILLAAILFILMAIIGGKKGVRSFFALFINFAVLIVAVLLMTIPQLDPMILTLIASAIISAINLFYINEVNSKTKTAYISTIITIIILLLFIVILSKKALIGGFGEEEVEELDAFSLFIGVDFVKIAASVIIMSTIGAITDSAMAISSPMREAFYHNPYIGRNELFKFGMVIGRDILGTNANTLFFAFFGGYLGLLFWFKDLSYSFESIINSKVFSAEMITILFAGTGVALVIPITALITAYSFVKTK